MTLHGFRPGADFLPGLAGLWREMCARHDADLADGLILLPTRRAARELANAFLDAADGAPMLLPRIVPLGGIDEAPLALAGALTLPPAIATPHRLAVLARLILAMRGANGAPREPGPAWTLAAELAALMDEAERAEIGLGAALARAVDAAHAEHWHKTVDFLRIVTVAWPDYLAEQGMMNPVARQVALMDAQVAAWRAAPPGHPVLAVSGAADIPSVLRLLATIADLPMGAVVVPGLDPGLSADEAADLPETHPQSGPCRVLAALGATAGEIDWHGEAARAGRAALLRRALLPASALAAWRAPFAPDCDGLSLIEAADLREEALAIALVLREALEVPGAQAALVTPDRGLAARVAAELDRFGIIADDSAGEPLAETPPAVLLRLLARAAASGLAPVDLLAALKHPLACAGFAPAEARRRVRAFEMLCLRGPAPLPGISGLRHRLDARLDGTDAPALREWLAALERCLAPVQRAMAAVAMTPADWLAALIDAAENLAASDEAAGPARLWRHEEGEALAALLSETLEALPALPADRPEAMPALLDAVLAGTVVRTRRALRGRQGMEHPRIAIWGLLEARLQSADVLVLGGLAEGVWPGMAEPGPWLSRPMRARAGLLSPEWQIGQAAQDFWQACLAAPRVVLSRALRRDRAPAVPSRWLTRLGAMLGDPPLPVEPALGWARRMDQPDAVRPAERPRPCPPLAARPRRLRVTEISLLRDDPYALYAQRVLGLRQLDPIADISESAIFGTIVHGGLHALLRDLGTAWPDDAGARLVQHFERELRRQSVSIGLANWWRPRLAAIADWVDGEERRRRAEAPAIAAITSEQAGRWQLAEPAMTLTGRADRIERLADGSLRIIDYKTGSAPKAAEVADLRALQLPLEAAMARQGAFGEAWRGEASSLDYWRLPGDVSGGAVTMVAAGTLAEAAEAALRALLSACEAADYCYTPPAIVLRPDRALSPWQHLARAGEWGRAEEPDADEDADRDADGDAA